MFQHISKEHNISEDDDVNGTDIQDYDEVSIVKRSKSEEAMDNEEKDKSFVLSESMFFDKYILKRFKRQNNEILKIMR